MAGWIQFGVLLTTLIAFLLRNEHRMTKLETEIRAEQKVSNMLERRIITLERKTV
jgi:hypothetical protein